MAGDVPPILERLATRVRGRRAARAMTQKDLAAASGLSQRYVASLEQGTANVSVLRLEAVASALGTEASHLIARDEAAAPFQTRPAQSGDRLVALLGLRGAGKTAIGKRAAARLGEPFVELDALIAGRAGMTLESLFTLHGADYYRRLEREELDKLVAEPRRGLLATGGGLVTHQAAFEVLRRATVTIFLKASAEDHWDRVVAQGDARPMENRVDAMAELRSILRARRPLYERADHIVDTTALGLERSVDAVVKITREAVSQRD